jgi:DNA (cytosine-5)-methyltransferase 1
LKHGSLFSGIGGFDLASEWIGWENVFHCEWNEFAQKVLKYHFPKSISYGNITKTDFTIHRGGIDILSGGFPCQPYSTSGRRKGKEDERHLWPEMLRAVREIQPIYVVGENVRGLTNWNGGLVFDEVQADLEAEGYEVLPFLLPACGKNAPHRRERIWFIAYSNGAKQKNDSIANRGTTEEIWGQDKGNVSEQFFSNGVIANTTGFGSQGQRRAERQISTKKNCDWEASWANADGGWPNEHPICSGNDGLSGKLDGITFREWSEESIKAYGNAIVPQVAFEIFKVINTIQAL